MKAADNVRYVELAPRPARPLIEEVAQAVEQLQDIKAERKEHFVGLYLNARHELLHNATAVIVAHNHPSGDATPSPEDRDVTQRLKEGGRLLGISVLDHIIITEYGYTTL